MMVYYVILLLLSTESLRRFGLILRSIFHLNGLNYNYYNSEKYARGRASANEIAAG